MTRRREGYTVRCPRCGDTLNLALDGYKILDVFCENEECTLAESGDTLTWQEYAELERDLAGDWCDAATDYMEGQ